MIAKLQCVVLDCADVVELSRFYQSLLGGVVNQPDPRWSLGDGWATLHTDSGLVLAFQRVEDHQPPRWPDPARPQQFHLDLGVKDLGQAQEDVLNLGATLLDQGSGKRSWRIFADPAGHPFCLVPDWQETPRVEAVVAEATTGLPPGAERLYHGSEAYLDLSLANQSVKGLSLETRSDPAMHGPMEARRERLAAARVADLEAMGWDDAEAAAQLLAAMTRELSALEFDAATGCQHHGGR